MNSDRIDLLLELVPDDVKIRFFRRKKTAISSYMDEPLTFLNQLQDHDLISEDLCQEVINERGKDRKEKGVYKILSHVEKQGGESIKVFWSCVFEDHMVQKYPFLHTLFKSLLEEPTRSWGRSPDAKELTGIEETKAEPKECGSKRKKGADEKEKMSRANDAGLNVPGSRCDDSGPTVWSSAEGKHSSLDDSSSAGRRPRLSACQPRQPTPPAQRSLGHCPPQGGAVGSGMAGGHFNTLPGKMEEPEDFWTLDCYKTELPVTCGNKEGILHRDKFAKAEECILSQNIWFTPPEFERFSGRGSSKNWKLSIRCQGTPLQRLIEEGHLQCPRTYRAYSCKKVTSSSPLKRPDPPSGSAPDTDESSDELGEWIEEEDIKQEVKEAEEEEEDDSEPVDLSEFQAFALPVLCGSLSAWLYKKRFAGSRSKSIRTEERWLTPEEFVKQGLTQPDGHWKKDILCHGKTLHYLVKKKILHIHSLLCLCRLCRPENKQDQDNDDVCHICNSAGNLVCCDECPRAFHLHCHLPALQVDPPEDKWMCTFCVVKTNQGLWVPVNMKDALGSPVSETIMQCQYLLLRLYKEDTKRTFADDPTTTVENYSSVIPKPMWLNKVKTNLQNKAYTNVKEFVRDLLLIFSNCKTFNKDNEFGRMGDTLSRIFIQEFHTIFNIH